MAPGPLHYSGMATGVLAGECSPEAHRIDAAELVRAGGGRFVRGRVGAIDPSGGAVHLAGGGRLAFDLLSLNLGSETRGAAPGLEGVAWPAKPVEGLVELGQELDRRAAAEQMPHLVVVGGGPTGCELALCAERRLAGGGRITLVAPGELLGPGFPEAAGERVRRVLLRRGVDLLRGRAMGLAGNGARAARGTPGVLRLDGGERLPFDLLLDAGGLRVPGVIAGSGLAVQDGALHVDASLRSIDDRRVFAVGDCAAFEGRALPRIGVHAVRQGPVLRDNLLAALRGDELADYRPQRHALLILNLGDRTALAVRGRWVFEGRAAWRLKRWIDRRFLARFSENRASRPPR